MFDILNKIEYIIEDEYFIYYCLKYLFLGVKIMENVFDYEDIQLIFVKCIVNSCLECDIFVCLGECIFKLFVVFVNMQMIIDEKLVI